MINRRMLAHSTENCIMQRKMYQWLERFHSARTSSVDEDHLGHPVTSEVTNSVGVDGLVQEDMLLSLI